MRAAKRRLLKAKAFYMEARRAARREMTKRSVGRRCPATTKAGKKNNRPEIGFEETANSDAENDFTERHADHECSSNKPSAQSTQYGDIEEKSSDDESPATPENSSDSSDSDTEAVPSCNSDNRNKTTSAYGFDIPNVTTKAGSKVKDIAELMKKDTWPLEAFKEITDARRGSWVRWAKRFKAVCSLVPNITALQARTMLLLKGGSKIWDIVGDDINKLTLEQIWNRVDRHYASLGDPDTELMKYHEMRQKEGEDFAEFIDRLKEQAIRAEMTMKKEKEELKAAIVERSLVASKLAYEMKTRKIDNNELIRLGVELCKRREQKQLKVQSITEQPVRQRPAAKESRSEQYAERKTNWNDSQRRRDPKADSKACRSCGKHHLGRCVARPMEKLCFKCGKPGHFAVNCNIHDGGPQKKQIHQVNEVHDDGWVD